MKIFLIIIKKIEFVVLLLVTRIQQLNSSNMITLSLDELREVISKEGIIKDNVSLEISLNCNVTLQIPIFPIHNSENIIDIL